MEAASLWLMHTRPERLRDMERAYVEDETVAPETPPATTPA
jgi:hypothetical protein